MRKRVSLLVFFLLISFLMFGCGEGSNGEDEVPKNGDTNGENNPDDGDPSNGDVDDEKPSGGVNLPSYLLSDTIESREKKTHTIMIDQAAVYDVFSMADFDINAVLTDANDNFLASGYQTGNFTIRYFLPIGEYQLEISGSTRSDHGDYEIHLEAVESLSDVYYYVTTRVTQGSMNEHPFTITEAGTYQIIGESDVNIEGRFYAGDKYLTQDHDSHDETGFLIEWELSPGQYTIMVRGYTWEQARYEVFVYKKS